MFGNDGQHILREGEAVRHPVVQVAAPIDLFQVDEIGKAAMFQCHCEGVDDLEGLFSIVGNQKMKGKCAAVVIQLVLYAKPCFLRDHFFSFG